MSVNEHLRKGISVRSPGTGRIAYATLSGLEEYTSANAEQIETATEGLPHRRIVLRQPEEAI